MKRAPLKVLMLCTGNSARSIIAEYLLRQKGKGRFETYSAGAKPTGSVNPFAQWVLLEHFGLDASGARSKSWDELKDVRFDLVLTVCDHVREMCPPFAGFPVSAHFGSPDPAALQGSEAEKKALFVQVADKISVFLDLLCALPEDQLDLMRVRGIGASFPWASFNEAKPGSG